MDTLKFTTILIRLAGFQFMMETFDMLTYLPDYQFRAAHNRLPSSQVYYDSELRTSIARIIFYFILGAVFCFFAKSIARIFASGLEGDAPSNAS